MNYYISDLHLFHKNVTREGKDFDDRLFDNLDEMHSTIKEKWNKKVTNGDTVYILGDMSIEELDEKMLDNLVTWQYNGSKSTINEFRQLDSETRRDVIDFIKDFLIYEEIAVNGKNYLLVHAGLGNYLPDKDIEDYSIHELIWTRADYDVQYFKNTYVVTGHTPTQMIEDNPHPGYIYRRNNHIAIDCGATYPGGRLAALCLDTGKEYYS